MKYLKIKTKLSTWCVSKTLALKCELGCKFDTYFCCDKDSEVSETMAAAAVFRANIRLNSLEGTAYLNMPRTQIWISVLSYSLSFDLMTFAQVKYCRVFMEFCINILLWIGEMFLNLRFTWFSSVLRCDCYESGPFLSVRFHVFHSYVHNVRDIRS
jgi:hypothetical protein